MYATSLRTSRRTLEVQHPVADHLGDFQLLVHDVQIRPGFDQCSLPDALKLSLRRERQVRLLLEQRIDVGLKGLGVLGKLRFRD